MLTSRSGYPCLRRLALQTVLAASLILAARANAQTPPPFSGAFDGSLLYDVSSGSLEFEGEATVHLTLGAWKASAEAGCDEGVWDEQTFEVLWAEEALEIESTVRFEPDKHRFKDWKTEVAWSFGAVDLELEHKLTRTRNWLTLEVDWASDALDIDTRVRLRSRECAPLAFYDAKIEAEFSLCGAKTSIEIEMDDDGFDALTLDIEDLVVNRIPWLSIDIEVERTLIETTIEIEPSIEFGKTTCFTFEADAAGDHGFVGALRLVEATFECDFPRGEIEATVYFDPDDWIDDQYAATLTLKTEGSLAPERLIETEITFFWKCVPTQNVVLSRMTPLIRLELTERISAWLELDIDLETAEPDSISAGIVLEW